MFRLLAICALLSGCQPAANKPVADGAVSRTSDKTALPETLDKTAWTLVAINGKPPVNTGVATTPNRAASIEFADDHLSGDSGCNSFSSLYLARKNKLYLIPPLATQRGCQEDLISQETGMFRLLSGTVDTSFDAQGRLILTKGMDSLTFARKADCISCNQPNPPRDLSITRHPWEIVLINDAVPIEFGKYKDYDLFVMRFEDDEWSVQIGCNQFGGVYRREKNRIFAQPGTTTLKGCSPDLAKQDDDAAAIMYGNPQYVIGHNKEMLLASDAGMMRLQGPPNPK
jgi:heat shock protein HslJ